MFLVRRINKNSSISAFCKADSRLNMLAYAPTQEIKPSEDGGLSTWCVESIDEKDIKKAVLAIATTSNELAALDIIAIDYDELDKYCLKAERTPAGVDVPYWPMKDCHFDILEVTLGKFVCCAYLYYDVILSDLDREKYVRRISKGRLIEHLTEAKNNNEIRIDKLKPKVREAMKWN